MKKVLAVLLSAMMVSGTASVAFAATEDVMFEDNTGATWYKYTSNADGNSMDVATSAKSGDTIYFKLIDNGAEDEKDFEETVNKLKVKASWDNGADLVESVTIEWMKGDPYVAVKFKDVGKTTDIVDLVGEVKLYRSSPNNEWDVLDINFNKNAYSVITFTENPDEADETDDYIVYGGGAETPTHVVKFDDLEDITIEFDGVGEFEINVKDQGKLYLGFDNKAKEEIADKYDYAELEFVNFNGTPKFNRNGVFYLYAEEGSFLYALKDGKLEAVTTSYDEDYDALKFVMKQFPESLVISDTELDLSAQDEATEGETTTEGDTTSKPNPSTGR